MLIFTSGTTGRPKAAVLSHRSVISYLMAQSFIGARSMALAGRDRAARAHRRCVSLRTRCSTSRDCRWRSAYGDDRAATRVWPLGRFDPGAVIELTKQEGVAVWGGGTTHVVRLLEHPTSRRIEPHQTHQHRDRRLGDPARRSSRQIEERFPHLQRDGVERVRVDRDRTAELGAGLDARAAPDCVGPPMPTCDPHHRRRGTCSRPARTATSRRASWQSMLGYWNNDEANAETILPGRWIRTGDFGRLERRGAVHRVARLRDLIIRGGENIYPFEIENRLDRTPGRDRGRGLRRRRPGVRPDGEGRRRGGPGATVTDDELQAFCAETLASYKVPAVVEIRTEPLPRTAVGKVMKHVLAGEAENIFVEE